MIIPELPPGLRSKYRLDRLLGSGGMSHVFLARQLELDREVAFKWVSRIDDLALGRFRRETQLLGSLKHPHLLAIYDAGIEDEVVYLVSEVLPGGTLRAAVGQSTLGEILQAFLELASALDLAHSRGVVHRDLKPENVFLAADRSTRLADFGLARTVDHGGTLTASGKICGTPLYMSPEQLHGSRLQPASDIYSLALMVHEMITGRVPGVGRSPLEVALDRLKTPFRSLRADLPGAPQRLDEILERSLRIDPDQRAASCGAFVEELADCLRSDDSILGCTPRAAWAPKGGGMVQAATAATNQVTVASSTRSDTQPQRTSPSGSIEPGHRRRNVRMTITGLLVLTLAAGVISVVQERSDRSPPLSSAESAPGTPQAAPAAGVSREFLQYLDIMEQTIGRLESDARSLTGKVQLSWGSWRKEDFEPLESLLGELDDCFRRFIWIVTRTREEPLSTGHWYTLEKQLQKLTLLCRTATTASQLTSRATPRAKTLQVRFDTLVEAARVNGTDTFATAFCHSARASRRMAFRWPLDPVESRLCTTEKVLAHRTLLAAPAAWRAFPAGLAHRALLLSQALLPWEERTPYDSAHPEVDPVAGLLAAAIDFLGEIRSLDPAISSGDGRTKALAVVCAVLIRLAAWKLEAGRPDEELTGITLALFDELNDESTLDAKIRSLAGQLRSRHAGK